MYILYKRHSEVLDHSVMFGTAFNNFEMWKHYEMCLTHARVYATAGIQNGDMPFTLEHTENAIKCLKWIKKHMFQGRFVDYKTLEDPIEDAIKEMRAALRTTSVFWNPRFMYFGRYVTANAKYIQGEGRWLYPDQAALYDPRYDGKVSYQL
jgi:hypothetical protein